ncbi:MAG: N-acetylornithine carbamoyltransferase [Candidatus Kapabacteria bacterium]|nr:N-acetylornithine carbamoyltransferase [Candidatus Kapabacteria bacterium]
MRRFTSVQDLIDGPGLDAALMDALEFARHPWINTELGRRRTVGLLFMNPSLRTRMSTQKAATMMGAETIILNAGSDSWTLETRDGVVMDGAATEHIKEAAGVMGSYCDVLGLRTFASLTDRQADYQEDILEKFIRYSGVPVVSLESATRHPLQSFADLITIEQMKRVVRPKVVLTWAPHPKALPQAVANSFVEWMSYANVDLVVTHPKGYELAPEFVGGVTVTNDQDSALAGADFVYAKNWSAYEPYGQILSKDTSWTITEEKMSLTNNAQFMHCLPVRRNMIVSDGVLDGPHSIVLQQAANRVVSAQTVLYYLLKGLQ